MAQRIENRTGKSLFEKTGTEVIKPRLRRTLMAPFGITGLKVEPHQARRGEPISISFSAINATDFTSIYPVTLKINGEVVAAEVISLPRNSIMPMKFTLGNTNAGIHDIEVNEMPGRFTVAGEGIEAHLAAIPGTKPDQSLVETESNYSMPVPAVPAKRELSVRPITSPVAEPQQVIDKAAGGIEAGLDKIGDGIILSIDRMVNAPGAILKKLRKK